MGKNQSLDLEKLHELHRQGKIKAAKKGYLIFLKDRPQSAEALHALALICVEEKKLNDAAEYLNQAMLSQPQNPTYQLHLANVLKMQGLFNQAATLLSKTVIQHPAYAPAYNNLGTVLYAQGKLLEAIQAYQKALEMEPHYVDAYYNLGLALTKSEALQKAVEVYQHLLKIASEHSAARYQLATLLMRQEKWHEATTLFLELALTHPEHLETLVNLASCYLKQGLLQDAQKYYLKALSLNEKDPQVLFNLGAVCTQQGKLEEAVLHYQALIRISPDHFAAHYNLGVIFFSKKMRAPALEHLQAALRIQPQNASVIYLIQVLKENQSILQSPPDYLKTLFDYYADHYEPQLVNILDYQVPQLLFEAFEASRRLMNKKLEILDLGCGTGLCGETFQFHAEKLIGVDLSNNMLAIAAEKKIYDELVCEDFKNYLSKQDTNYDLILAGDVFVYHGDLASIFKAVHLALRPGGLLIFNTEIEVQEAYVLNASGRFGHSKKYIEKLAAELNFELLLCKRGVTRLQDGKAVNGLIYVLEKH